jgi:hypothetical protein
MSERELRAHYQHRGHAPPPPGASIPSSQLRIGSEHRSHITDLASRYVTRIQVLLKIPNAGPSMLEPCGLAGH